MSNVFVVDAYDGEHIRKPLKEGDDGLHNNALSMQHAKGILSALFWISQDPQNSLEMNPPASTGQIF
eukprot:TRINITY_DN14596_c0_g1_i1.p3 TRINITY_DN14596_c0_g1~~TRINITY_DN14596_c0_g1_i1.p3  ORF type:complete len:67 (-),score=17.85 TRINITY_DN14596_c0_g1_i1:296-496(-)